MHCKLYPFYPSNECKCTLMICFQCLTCYQRQMFSKTCWSHSNSWAVTKIYKYKYSREKYKKNVHSAKGKTVPPPEWHVGCRPWGRKLIAAWCDGWKVAQVSFTHQAPALCKISDRNTTTNENTNTDEKWPKSLLPTRLLQFVRSQIQIQKKNVPSLF